MKTLWRTCALLLFLAPTARAGVIGPLDITVHHRCLGGEDQPGLSLHAEAPVRGITVTLERVDGPRKVFRIPSMKAGETRRVGLPQAPGREYYRAVVEVAGHEPPYEVAFSAAVARTFRLEVPPEGADLAQGRIAIRLQGDPERVMLTLTDTGGRELLKKHWRLDLSGEHPEVLTFDPPAEAVGRVEVVAEDPEGFRQAVEFSPVVMEVPHDEVLFEFGKAEILPDEEPKLARVLEETHRVLARLGGQLRLRLYVAGYTDTVGSREFNQSLSAARAAATALWLKAHGLKVPVCSQGFGEDALAVPTPDETPEPRNRRSLFVLAAQGPLGASFPRGAWVCH